MRTALTFAGIATVLVRPALWFCAWNLLAAVLAAQCSNPTPVPNQTISSGTRTFADNNALRATAVVVSGSASVTFVAGNCIELDPGFRATAGTAGTTFHAWVQTVPTADSVSPASGSGLSQQFIWKASSPSGYSNLAEIFGLFNTSTSGQNACYIRYNRAANLLYMSNNAGTGWVGGFVPGSSGTASNSQCSINGAGSSVSGAGNQLTLTVSVTFQTSFAGAKNDYLIAYDNAGLNSGWQQVGTWTVSATSNPKTTITTNPANLLFKVDGITYNAATDFFWTPGSSHIVEVPTFQGTGSTRNVFSYWSDGGSARHQITASSSGITYTATFTSRTVTATMQGPSRLEVNLSYMPFDYYDDNHSATSTDSPTVAQLDPRFAAASRPYWPTFDARGFPVSESFSDCAARAIRRHSPGAAGPGRTSPAPIARGKRTLLTSFGTSATLI